MVVQPEAVVQGIVVVALDRFAAMAQRIAKLKLVGVMAAVLQAEHMAKVAQAARMLLDESVMELVDKAEVLLAEQAVVVVTVVLEPEAAGMQDQQIMEVPHTVGVVVP
jgi:hypothetical protein